MNKIAIQDANILIDLMIIDLCEHIFELDLEFHSSDFVLNELNEDQNSLLKVYIDNHKLIIDEQDEMDIESIVLISSKIKTLSFTDCSVFVLAEKMDSILLTGDLVLRKYASANSVEVHGILWLLDQLVESNIISARIAYDKLLLLLSKNERLPKAECNKRLLLWKP